MKRINEMNKNQQSTENQVFYACNGEEIRGRQETILRGSSVVD